MVNDSYSQHSVKFNVVMNVLLTASNMLVVLISLPYVTRVLSVESYGAVGFAQSAATWFSTFCMLGVPIYGIRECARVRNDKPLLAKTVKELLIILTVCTAAVLGVFALCILIIPAFWAESTLMWVFFASTLMASYGIEWFYQAIEQYRYITIRSVIVKLLSLIAIFLFVRHPGDALLYGAILAFFPCCNNIINLIHLPQVISLRGGGHLEPARHVKPVLSFGLVSIASGVYLWLDTVILGMLTPGNYEVGLYQLAVKMRGFLSTAINAALNTAIPRLAYYFAAKERDKYLELLAKGLLLVFNLGLCLVGYLFVFSDQIVVFLASLKYMAAVPALQVTAVALFFSSIAGVIGYQVLTPQDMEREFALANVMGVPICLLANVILDPRLGALGAAVAAVLTECVVTGVEAYYARATLRKAVFPADAGKVGVAVLAAVCASLIFRHCLPDLSTLACLLSSIVTYFVVWVAALLLLHEQSIQLLFTTVRRHVNKA